MQSWTVPAPATVPAQSDRLRLMDTSTGELRHPGTEGAASLYVCGITPYDATHLGHANTYVSFDLLQRYWRACGYPVSYVQNVTDVDDPLLERAEATGVDWRELARDQTELFRTDMVALNVLAPDHYVGATETVDWVVETVSRLVQNGTAYTVPGQGEDPDGDVYFDIGAAQSATDWTLGSISGMSPEQMAEVFPERGGDPERPGKRSPLDPLLWRAARSGEPSWDGGPLGEGRPGWHIECSAIARRLLPVPFSVQGGGSDLKFPHHEFSAAHATAVDGQPLARTFVHAGMVALHGEKMSKSKGNLVLVSNLRREGADPAAIRTALLSHHYRSDWEWTEDSLPEASARLSGWRHALEREEPGDAQALVSALHGTLSDDLNAPAALVDLDRWAESTAARTGSPTAAHQELRVSAVVDALLGIRL
ncbi:cysteine--1-D-myo-inosityl 2-amino-2-deoxy-alpha-D-glucopyranoside ligase [Micrococcus terreus]|uniref:cysteine--1-D-myo-inosityl 2-amino-2-deoxy-alpha-D-glucopyranoside ligase n=1 Tax=Micrococcus terreus TaxID=574650 RepID=UPI0021A3BE83|nr:cysteine--1-D-myo-inosityl 2-amino-2-deoxy-alpha-D-glucopyranoside ligase [Micrococcus terreus]MCT2088412.1 cysteine--1-D-myo-inosityl 2-amino-2-deoxy-alpha-D-glucopyranoside ligase [Micrococcus terreus]MDK7699913.1 cysteine--1-D-myo-inosityl 2-amino-2-deoxy-alpha-D-glucopyranoside ligase [Micrococcus terreus]WOO98303.1 cysteine--1-D-myo-inosityl 2-amino-2-deoxy-alpha-D-glucopyranoside ligase [Micrococcus terreus]